jgi:hypothetical protein
MVPPFGAAPGGFEVTYTNTRYLSREVFVELVRHGFAGTTKAGTDTVVRVAAEWAQTNEVVLALKTVMSEGEPANRAYPGADDLPF